MRKLFISKLIASPARAFGRRRRSSFEPARLAGGTFFGYGCRLVGIEEACLLHLRRHAPCFAGEFPVCAEHADVIVRYRSHKWSCDIEPHFKLDCWKPTRGSSMDAHILSSDCRIDQCNCGRQQHRGWNLAQLRCALRVLHLCSQWDE